MLDFSNMKFWRIFAICWQKCYCEGHSEILPIWFSIIQLFTRLWKVFYDDKDRPNRYLLAKEQISRPEGADLEVSDCQNFHDHATLFRMVFEYLQVQSLQLNVTCYLLNSRLFFPLFELKTHLALEEKLCC